MKINQGKARAARVALFLLVNRREETAGEATAAHTCCRRTTVAHDFRMTPGHPHSCTGIGLHGLQDRMSGGAGRAARRGKGNGDGVHLLTSALVKFIGIARVLSGTLLTCWLVSWRALGRPSSRGALEASGDDFQRNSFVVALDNWSCPVNARLDVPGALVHVITRFVRARGARLSAAVTLPAEDVHL
jgi:hypothetical protein